jgi:hypothetical protein
MQKNVGSADKVVPLLTAAFGSCPLYSILGMSTCPASARK